MSRAAHTHTEPHESKREKRARRRAPRHRPILEGTEPSIRAHRTTRQNHIPSQGRRRRRRGYSSEVEPIEEPFTLCAPTNNNNNKGINNSSNSNDSNDSNNDDEWDGAMKRGGGRKPDKGTRRARQDIAAPSEATASLATMAYEVQGDSALALSTYQSLLAAQQKKKKKDGVSLTQLYNRRLLSYLESNGSDDAFLSQMEQWRDRWEEQRAQHDEGLSPRKKKAKEFTILFNDCLVQYVQGRATAASGKLLQALKPMVLQRTVLHEDLRNVVSRMAFLLLDCLLLLSEASHSGVRTIDKDLSGEAVVGWIESQDFANDPQLKFLLSLYKSRLDFAARDEEESRLVDSKVRGVKKELKVAMELFNHKLRISGDMGSVGGSSDIHSEDGSERSGKPLLVVPPSSSTTTTTTTTAATAATTPANSSSSSSSSMGANHSSPQERLLQAHNQSALNLKAHLEQLKGNTKKSLVLCTEARTSLQDPAYDRVDANNLAIVYATCRKKYMALHTAGKALKAPGSGLFQSDGRACPDTSLAVAHNSGLYALQAKHYSAAYESFANCVKHSTVFRKRPRCWLRMAEACLGKS